MERDFFSIIEDDGRKFIKYWGHTEVKEDDYYGDYGESIEHRHCWYPICLAMIDYAFGDKPSHEVIRYGNEECSTDCYGFNTREEYEAYNLGYYGKAVFGFEHHEPNPGKFLVVEDVDFDTPCGDYWF